MAKKLFNKIAREEGLGETLAEGQKADSEYVGEDAHKFMSHIKGAGMASHDQRATWSTPIRPVVKRC